MTIGYGVPPDEDEQVHFVRELHDARIAGIAIGDHQQAPPLTPGMLQTADELGFPVLRTAYEKSFSFIIRAVAMANQTDEYARLVQTLRIYDQVRFALTRVDPFTHLINVIEHELGCTIHVVDRTGSVLLDEAKLDPEAQQILRAKLRRNSGGLSAITRFDTSDTAYVGVSIPVRDGCLLIASGDTRSLPAPMILQHVGAVLALEVERRKAESERRRLGGETLWERLLDGRADPQSTTIDLTERGLLTGSGLRVVAFRVGEPLPTDELKRQLDDYGVPHICVERGSNAFLLVSGDSSVVHLLDGIFDGRAPAGCSGEQRQIDAIAPAIDEARWSLTAPGEERRLVRYGDEIGLFLPATVEETRSVVTRVLGELIQYDDENETQLRASLRTFLECNRSWQRTSTRLNVHKQTVVYRMRRVEELTGKQLDSTGDIAELWLSLRAYSAIAPP